MQDRTSNGDTSWIGLYGRSITLAARIAFGPKRPPTRLVTPVSNGTPMTATSTSPSERTYWSRANNGGPVKRGLLRESSGPYRGIPGVYRAAALSGRLEAPKCQASNAQCHDHLPAQGDDQERSLPKAEPSG